MNSNSSPLILVTGATGYVGARLAPRLLEAGYRVRVLVRDAERLNGRSWASDVEIVVGDVLKPDTLPPALEGVHAAYYLIHSMSAGANFEDRDKQAAHNFGRAAADAGCAQIIYLSGLGSDADTLSSHLQSRHDTGAALRDAGIPVTEFRAAVVVGSGSVSFEMVRHLTERLPVMIVPRWAATRIQPISIRDVLAYLIAALAQPACRGEIVEIGGADTLTYAEMMTQYADERGLRRLLLPAPVLTPALSSYWVHWTTPIPANIARPLINGLRNEVVVRDDAAQRLFAEITPLPYRAAVQLALERLRDGDLESIWSDALSSSQGDEAPFDFQWEQGMLLERREAETSAAPDTLFGAVSALGGQTGWLVYDWLWAVRGAMDRLVGGVGLRRGRRDPQDVRVGDAVDFWRVEAVQENELLRLRAEMKLPGRAWLEFRVQPLDNGRSRLIQTAYFAPKGLFGLLYWYAVFPLHGLIFPQMAQAIARRAEGETAVRAKRVETAVFAGAVALVLAIAVGVWQLFKQDQ